MKRFTVDRDTVEQWLPRLLMLGFILELINLFAIATTHGLLQMFPLPGDRFRSFAVNAFVCWVFFAALKVYRHRSEDSDRRRHHAAELFVIALCLLGAYLFFLNGIRLSADSPHYFVQARSILFDADLDFQNDYEHVHAPRPIAERYPVGMALLSLPLLLATHGLVLLSQALGYAFESDGFGYPYQTAFGLTGYLLGSIGLIVVLRTTSRFFSTGISTIGLVTLWASSFLFWYMVAEPAMPHAASFACTSFFLCYWVEKRPLHRTHDWVTLGALAGLASLVRWQNGVLLVLPLIDHLLDSPRSSLRCVWTFLAAAVCFLPQLLFWKITAGGFLAVPLAGHGVDWTQLSLLQVVFSTNRGLFTWNPIFYLGAIGLLIWTRQSKRLALLFLLGFVLQVVVNGNVAIWWAGWSFGGRRFDSCVLFFVIGVSAFFQFLRRKPLVPVLGLSGLLVLWNAGVMMQSRTGEIQADRLVSFQSVSESNLRRFYRRLGFPFASPLNWLFAFRHDVSPEKFDRLYGHEGFGNMRLPFDAASEPYVGRGWGDTERDSSGRWFRWAVGDRSTLLVPLKKARDYQLFARVRAYSGALPNRIGLRVNGSANGVQIVADETILQWTSEERNWRSGINEISFEYARTAKPSDSGVSPDSRELAAAFYQVNLISIPKDD